MIEKQLTRVRSTRDLRAEIPDLATTAAESNRPVRLDVIGPVISADTLRAEWKRAMPPVRGTVLQARPLRKRARRPCAGKLCAGREGSTRVSEPRNDAPVSGAVCARDAWRQVADGYTAHQRGFGFPVLYP